MIRNVSAVIVGIIAGLLVTVIGLLVFSSIYPQPYSFEVLDRSEKLAWERSLPQSAYHLKWGINIIAAFSAAILSTIIAANKKTFSFIGLFIFILIIVFRDNSHQYGYSFTIINIVLMMITGCLAIFIGSRRIKDIVLGIGR